MLGSRVIPVLSTILHSKMLFFQLPYKSHINHRHFCCTFFSPPGTWCISSFQDSSATQGIIIFRSLCKQNLFSGIELILSHCNFRVLPMPHLPSRCYSSKERCESISHSTVNCSVLRQLSDSVIKKNQHPNNFPTEHQKKETVPLQSTGINILSFISSLVSPQ